MRVVTDAGIFLGVFAVNNTVKTQAVNTPSFQLCDLVTEAPLCSLVFSFPSVVMHVSRSHIQFPHVHVFSALQGFLRELLVLPLSLHGGSIFSPFPAQCEGVDSSQKQQQSGYRDI